MPAKKIPAVIRQDMILKELQERRFGTTMNFAKTLAVSEMTVRRDLDQLAERGLLNRMHGGAASLNGIEGLAVDLVEPQIAERQFQSSSSKRAIADHAFQYIKPKQTIAMDIGTTTFGLATMAKGIDIRLFTGSLKIAAAMQEARAQVYIPGGRIFGSEPSVVGQQAVSFLRDYYYDIAFIGASGITSEGIFDYSPEDTEIKRVLIERSAVVIALIDNSKFDRISLAKVCDFAALDILITDQSATGQLGEALRVANVQIEIVS